MRKVLNSTPNSKLITLEEIGHVVTVISHDLFNPFNPFNPDTSV